MYLVLIFLLFFKSFLAFSEFPATVLWCVSSFLENSQPLYLQTLLLSHLSSSGIQITHVWGHMILCHISCALCCCWVPLPLFLTFWASMCIICIYLSSSSFFFSLACVTSDASVDILVFCYHVFLFYNFHLTLSYSFYICWLSLFVHSCSSSFPL